MKLYEEIKLGLEQAIEYEKSNNNKISFNTTVFVITDVHGFYTEMMNALVSKGFDINNPNHLIISLGDEFDRGQEAVQVFDFLNKMDKEDRLLMVRGNHTDLLEACLNEIQQHKEIINDAHILNNTIDTIGQFLPQETKYIVGKLLLNIPLENFDVEEILTVMKPVVDLLNRAYNSISYNDYYFVHGWIPDDYTSEGIRQARWKNGMEEWSKGKRKDDYTVVCGHWHCSWGWSHLRGIGEEFPDFTIPDWDKSFEPFIDDGIIALDACTAYSGKVNVLVIK